MYELYVCNNVCICIYMYVNKYSCSVEDKDRYVCRQTNLNPIRMYVCMHVYQVSTPMSLYTYLMYVGCTMCQLHIKVY